MPVSTISYYFNKQPLNLNVIQQETFISNSFILDRVSLADLDKLVGHLDSGHALQVPLVLLGAMAPWSMFFSWQGLETLREMSRHVHYVSQNA